MQQDILFPASGKTDVEKWDIQMLTGIILILFNNLETEERQSLRRIKRLRIEIAHSPSTSFSSEEYYDFVTELESAITKLASKFEQNVQYKCSQLSKEYESCPLEVKSTIEDLNKLKETDAFVGRIIDKIEGTMMTLSDKLKETSRESQANIINAVRELLEEKLQTEPSKKVRSVVNARLTLGGDESTVNLADKILDKVINAAIKRLKVTDTADKSQLAQAVDGVLEEFDKIEAAQVLTAKPECVLIKIQCDTYNSLYDVLEYTNSQRYKELLDLLAELLTSHCNAENPLVIFSSISIDCSEIFNRTAEDTAKKSNNSVPPVHCETRQSTENVIELFDKAIETLSIQLEGMSDHLSKMNEKHVYDGESVHEISRADDVEPVSKNSLDYDFKRCVSHTQLGEISEQQANPRGEKVASVINGKTKLVVAAIDIGNTFIANAYSYGGDFERDHLKLQMYQGMENSIGIIPSKNPTVALFDEGNEFDSFGYEAEAKYAQFLEEADDEKTECHWRFFSDLSLGIQREKQYMLEDNKKQTMPALDVYVAILKSLKSQITNYLQRWIKDLSEKDIHWVLPVPVSDNERQFFMQAAEKACFPEARLTFVPKPKAAAIYCKELLSSSYIGYLKSKSFKSLIAGEKFLVFDAGCQTTSVTAHRVLFDDSIADLESFSAIDRSGAGCLVDVNLEIFMKEIFGDICMEYFRVENKVDALELKHSMEMMKLEFKDPENEKADYSNWLKVPSNLLKTFKDINGCQLSERRREDHKIIIPAKGNKIYLSNEVVLDLYKDLSLHLTRQLRDMFQEDRLRDVKTIVFVGGLADSEILRNELRHAFPLKTMIFPDKSSTAIAKGAVIYGHTTEAYF